MTTQTGHLEEILLQLLAPDNSTIVKATAQLKSIVQDPAIVPALCTVLVSSTHLQVRQYAAILLRRKVLKTKQWASLPTEVTMNMRMNILQILLSEPVLNSLLNANDPDEVCSRKAVRKAVVQLIATVAKHELAQAKWPELFEFIYRYAHSNQSDQRELGMYVLSQVTSVASERLKSSLLALLELCSGTMTDQNNHMVAFHTLRTLTDLVPLVGDEEVKVFQEMLPSILQVISFLISVDEDVAIEAMEILDELVETEVAVIVPHIRMIIEFCLQIGTNRELGHGVRIKALSFVSWLTRLKKKSITKLHLTEQILTSLFTVICEGNADGEMDDEDDDTQTTSAFAASVIDVMAQNLPPDRFIQPMMHLVEPALNSPDPNRRQAAFIALAVCCEGCADHMKHRYLDTLMQYIHRGLTDPCTMVKNVTLFTVGQFAEHLQPDISKYSKDLMPVLFDYLGRADLETEKDTRGVTKTYYALEMFCENLGKDILPYLPQLMQYLLTSVRTSSSLHAKALAISAIGATANAAQEDLAPYFPQIIDELNKFLSPTEAENEVKVQLQSLDTLAVLARTIKRDHFMPLANHCIQLALNLLRTTTDPDLKRCVYGLLAAISTLLQTEMQPCLSTIITEMLESVKSTEGITPHYTEEETRIFHIFDDDVEDDDDEEPEDELEALSVENAYLEEKADACNALAELSLETKSAFLPFVETCFNEITKLLDYPAVSVRRGAVGAVAQFCCTVASEVTWSPGGPDAHAALHAMIGQTVPKLLSMVMMDHDVQVAMTTLEMINKMVQKIGGPVVNGEGLLKGILSVVKNVMQHKTACQDADDDDRDDEEAEFDMMLVENAGEVIPSVAKVIGGQAFAPFFAGLLPELLKRVKTTSTTAEKSFATGVMAETLSCDGTMAAVFAQHLYPVFVTLCTDEDEEVRSNTVFAVGMLVANGAEAMYSYEDIIKKMFNILNHETDGKVIDNVAATLCRLIKTNVSCVPLATVLPVVLKCLPLKSDFEENEVVYSCLVQLYYSGNQDLLKLLPAILEVLAQVMDSENFTEDLRQMLARFLTDVAAKYPVDVQTVVSGLSAELAATLDKYCVTTPTAQPGGDA